MKYYTWVQAWEQGWGQCPWGDLLVWQLVSLPSCPSGHKGRRVYSSNYKKCEIWSKLLRYLIRVNATEWSAGGLGVAHFDYCRFCKIRKCAFTLGDIASDLYGPQFWDDNFQFSFSVVVSCKSNKQLGYFWWKNGTSSLKTLFTHFELTFVNLMSRHDTCDFSRFTW